MRLAVKFGGGAALGAMGFATAALAERGRQYAEARAHTSALAAQKAESLRAESEAKFQRAEATRKLIESNWRSGVPPGLDSLTPEQITQARSGFLDGKTHIAIVGHSGAGKSTLTNRLRGLSSDKGPDAAVVSENEATHVVTPYPDNLHPQHVWYDVPGSGTLYTPDWQYFMDHKLYAYDALIVVFADRITSTDLTILKNAKECGIPTFFVRAKSDQIMRNMALAEVDESDEDEWSFAWPDEGKMRQRYIDSTREYVRRVLLDAGLDSSQLVYMVSRKGVYMAVNQRPGDSLLDEEQLIHDLLQVRNVDEIDA
jgi:GTP-binding protein EngB required for normal cell division